MNRTAKSLETKDALRNNHQFAYPKNIAAYFPNNRFGSNLIHRKAFCSCGGGCPSCQSGSYDLNVSHPNDPAEIEADRVADRVMRMPDDSKAKATVSGFEGVIHRKCKNCLEEEETVRRKALPEVGRSHVGLTDHVRNTISGDGIPLNRQTRNFFEPRFSYDLSSVRVHTTETAAHSADALGAKAYTLGKDIVFGRNEYRPDSDTGKQLLAHELAHVIQSGNEKNNQINRQPAVAAPTSEDVWGFRVKRSMCGCRQAVRDGIAWANTAGATYAACDTPANPDSTSVEACFDAAHPGTTVAGSTSSSGTVTLPPTSVDPCEQIENQATFVHETMHSRHTDSIARAQGTAFFTEWRRLAGDPNRLTTMRATFPAEVAAFSATWHGGHDWAQDEVNSYLWERRFLQDVLSALKRIC